MVGVDVAVYSQPRKTENVLELVHFEELPLGTEWRTRRRTITAADMAAFVGLSGDFNPLYTDAEHARAGHFGEPVVPGALVAAVTAGLGAIDVPVPATVGLVGMTWRFLRPVRPGDTIRSVWRLNRKRPVENPRWGLAVWQVEVENQRGELVAVADVTRIVSRREQPAEAARQGKSSRRRRRRGVPEIVPGADLPPKPTPGPVREPIIRPAVEPPWRPPQQPTTEPAPPAQEPAAAEGTSRRRRRGSDRARPEPQVAESPAVAAETAVVEPPSAAEESPAEAPAPSRRRRRRSPAAAEAAPAPPPVEPEPESWAPPSAPEALPRGETPAPQQTRSRRRRPAGGQGAAEEQAAGEREAEPKPPRRRRRSRPAEPAATEERTVEQGTAP